ELKSSGFSVSQGALQALREDFGSGRASEEETSSAITRTLEEAQELLCPHSAVGVKVADEARRKDTPMVTLATAHPAKFPTAVEAATGHHPPLPDRMADLYERPERVTRAPGELAALEALIKDRIPS
ncbi:MAG: threonine synthase, partial [Pseudomonadota bacterium]